MKTYKNFLSTQQATQKQNQTATASADNDILQALLEGFFPGETIASASAEAQGRGFYPAENEKFREQMTQRLINMELFVQDASFLKNRAWSVLK